MNDILELLETKINVLDRMHQVLSIGEDCKAILNKQIRELKEMVEVLKNE